MGYKEHDAKRALRMNNQDVGTAIDFLVEEKAKKEQKREEDICRRNEIMWVFQINLEINYSLYFLLLYSK